MNLTKQVWSKYFSSKILARGREYYRTDAVGELFFNPKNHLLTADVYGTEIYGVSVQLNAYDNDIEDMDCDCPYAFDGENCKHMAVVLFALETQGVPKRDNAECVKEISLEEAVQRLSEEEAKAYVTMEPLKTLKTKLTSRKFWAAVVGVIIGVATVFRLDEGVISTFSGSVMTMASILVYILTEGRIDKARTENDLMRGSVHETEFNDKGEVTKTTTTY